MTGGDLLILIPWALFGAALAVMWLRLRRFRRPARGRAAAPRGRWRGPGR